MKSLTILIINILFITVYSYSQGYEMKPGESVNVDLNGNILNSKLNTGQTQNQANKKTELNDDGTYKIPGYTPTDKASVNQQNYAKAKYKLYNENIDEYYRIFGKPTELKTVTTISNEEFLSLPNEKQEYILSHPDLYFIDNK